MKSGRFPNFSGLFMKSVKNGGSEIKGACCHSREVYTVTQAFDIYSRMKGPDGFMFKSPMKRGIIFFVLDKMRFGQIELSRLKENFPIDHESLRQFINMMVDAGYFEKLREGKQTFIRATEALQINTDAAVNEVCAGLQRFENSFKPYSDFIDWLNIDTDQVDSLVPAAQ
jgi:predicted transcriptional regulator